jgi:anti-sigma regulatory factor (Ser/Thr protein kinase)
MPAVTASVAPLIEYVLETARRAALTPERLMNLELVLEELLLNVVDNGFPEGPKGWIELAARPRAEGGIRVYVEDNGVPFDPLARPDPDLHASFAERPLGGLGIYLVRQLATDHTYEYTDRKTNLFSFAFAPA